MDHILVEKKNMEGETYYERNREHILAYNKARYDPERAKTYNKEYYLKNKDKIKKRQQERTGATPRQAAEKTPARPRGRPRTAPGPKVNKARLPRQYIVYEKSDEEEPKPFGYPTKPHQVEKMKEICPLGFYQPPPSSNPFVLTF